MKNRVTSSSDLDLAEILLTRIARDKREVRDPRVARQERRARVTQRCEKSGETSPSDLDLAGILLARIISPRITRESAN